MSRHPISVPVTVSAAVSARSTKIILTGIIVSDKWKGVGEPGHLLTMNVGFCGMLSGNRTPVIQPDQI
jgi:hypothetical protein